MRLVELALDALEGAQHHRDVGGVVHLPVLLGRQSDARTVRTAALVRATERRCRRPRRRDELPNGEARAEDLLLELAGLDRVDYRAGRLGYRVLPDLGLGGNPRTQQSR